MASWGSCDFHELRDLNERIKAAASEPEMDAFYTGLLDEMMNGLLKNVKRRTPYKDEHLKRNWFITHARRSGKHYRAEIYNNIEYAPWVENGHRQEIGRYVPAIGNDWCAVSLRASICCATVCSTFSVPHPTTSRPKARNFSAA